MNMRIPLKTNRLENDQRKPANFSNTSAPLSQGKTKKVGGPPKRKKERPSDLERQPIRTDLSRTHRKRKQAEYSTSSSPDAQNSPHSPPETTPNDLERPEKQALLKSFQKSQIFRDSPNFHKREKKHEKK
jgi:hypothetical protein